MLWFIQKYILNKYNNMAKIIQTNEIDIIILW